jgi:hypothetical protein
MSYIEMPNKTIQQKVKSIFCHFLWKIFSSPWKYLWVLLNNHCSEESANKCEGICCQLSKTCHKICVGDLRKKQILLLENLFDQNHRAQWSELYNLLYNLDQALQTGLNASIEAILILFWVWYYIPMCNAVILNIKCLLNRIVA